MRWIKSAGGPLIVIGTDVAPIWRGIRGNSSQKKESISRLVTDYVRACEIRDYVGVIEVAKRNAIILGDMPLATAVWKNKTNFTFIIRLFYTDPGEDIISLVNAQTDEDFGRAIEALDFYIECESLLIFDAAFPGNHRECEALSFSLPTGRYDISTYKIDPNPRTSLLAHRFQVVA